MRRWLRLGLWLGVCTMAWAQQVPTPSSAPSPASSSHQDSSTKPDQSGSAPANPAPGGDSRKQPPTPNLAPPRSDRVRADELGSELGQSSSKQTQIDLSPPEDDAKAHPQSSAAMAEAAAATSGGNGITEVHTWDPHKAAKSVEVGDFYFRRKNYRAAEGRYRDALVYKDNDALATIKLAVCLEKLGVLDDARAEYESYLRILPHGPQSEEARRAIDRLKAGTAGSKLE